MLAPPAISTISGIQLAAIMSGSIHSMQATDGFCFCIADKFFIFFSLIFKFSISLLLDSFSILRPLATLLISSKTSFKVLGSRDIILVFRLKYLLTMFFTSEKLTAHTSQCAWVIIKSGSNSLSF